MFSALLIVAPMALATIPPLEPVTGFANPVDDASLAAVVGMAAPTTRLSVFVSEQGVGQSQRLAEDQRVGFDNWFADNNLQIIANMRLRGD